MKYQIVGEPLPVAICTLEPGQTIITERGSMSWMTPNVKMETKGVGGVGKMIGRAFSGESAFQNKFTAEGGTGQVAFASSFPGSIRGYEIAPGKELIVQKSAFLACDEGVELSVFFQKKFGVGAVGGEGFIMQKLSGSGTALIEIDGHAVEYELQAGQSLIIDNGHLAAMSATCTMDVRMNKGVKNLLFGGEGAFNTVVTGPGIIVLQTMPAPGFAEAITPFLPLGENK